MKIRLIIKIFLFVFIIGLNFLGKVSYEDQGQPEELIFSTNGLNPNDEWWVTYYIDTGIPEDEIRWWNDHKLTNNYSSGSSSHQFGDPRGGYGPGFEAPDNWDESHPVVAYGYYLITFHCPTNLNVNGKWFYLDLRDADWSTNYSPSNGDIYIEWNLENNKFEFCNDIMTGTFDHGSVQKIWNLFNRTYPNTEAFQPTPPMIFTCTNPTQTGENPHFEWQIPWQPEDVSFKYKIYRKKNSGSWILQQDNITTTEWTDEEVEIDPVHGNTYSYYATAYTNLSPESDPSYVETIHGFRDKNKPFQPDEDFVGNIINENNFYCTNYPNPFNPTTNISYSVPTDGFVQLKFYNISGQLIKELKNKFHPAGTYQISFNGTNFPAGIYFVIFYYDQQKFLMKILLTK